MIEPDKIIYRNRMLKSRKYPKYKLYKYVKILNEKYFWKSYIKVLDISFYDMNDFWGLSYDINKKYRSLKILITKDLMEAPEYVLKYIIYHEMLHALHLNHTREFQRRERQYVKYTAADLYLDKLLR